MIIVFFDHDRKMKHSNALDWLHARSTPFTNTNRYQLTVIVISLHDHIIRQIREPTEIKNLCYELVL